MDNCIFCQIVKGELPCYKIYENENYLAFLDIFPRNKAHTLVIPKKHYRWVYDVADFANYWAVALKITKAIQKGFSTSFISYLTYGLDIHHAHIQIIPHYENEINPSIFPEVKKFSEEEMREIASKIIDNTETSI